MFHFYADGPLVDRYDGIIFQGMGTTSRAPVSPEIKQLAYELVDPIQVDDVEDIELAKKVLDSISNPVAFNALPPSLQGRVRTVCEHVTNPGALITDKKNHDDFRDVVLKRTAERIQQLTKFQADYTELVDGYLDPASICNEADAKSLAESLKSIIDPEEKHTVSQKYQNVVDDLKYLLDNPQGYLPQSGPTEAALEKTFAERIRFREIVERRIQKRIAELSKPTSREQLIKDSIERDEAKQKDAVGRKALEDARAEGIRQQLHLAGENAESGQAGQLLNDEAHERLDVTSEVNSGIFYFDSSPLI